MLFLTIFVIDNIDNVYSKPYDFSCLRALSPFAFCLHIAAVKQGIVRLSEPSLQYLYMGDSLTCKTHSETASYCLYGDPNIFGACCWQFDSHTLAKSSAILC